MKKLLNLFFTFAKIGAFTFGGGYAMLTLLQKEVVDNHKWVSEEELLDYYAIGQCTPGVIAVNTATFIGMKQCKIPGAIFATLGVITPSIIIITIIAAFLNMFLEYQAVIHFLSGIRVVVAVLVINAVITMGKKAIVDKVCIIISIVSLLLSLIFDLSPILIVLGAAAVGLILKRGGVKK